MSDAVRLPDLQSAEVAWQARINTARLGRVVAYADATGRATVQFMRRPKDRRGFPILQPPIPGVPVLWLGLGALLGIRGTLQPGDDVLIVVLDRDHSPYFTQLAPFDASSSRMHDLSDMVAIPVHFRLTPVGAPNTIRVGGPAAVNGVVDGNAGAAAALQGAIATLGAFILGSGYPPMTPVANDPTGAAAASALNAIIPALFALLQTLAVSNVVKVE